MEKDEERAGAFEMGDKDPLSVDDYLVLSEIEAEARLEGAKTGRSRLFTIYIYENTLPLLTWCPSRP